MSNAMDEIDPFYLAMLYFRMNKITEASTACTKILEKNPLDQAAWSLKLACFTEEVYIDELENDEAGFADAYMDDHAIVTGARPGTSLNRPITDSGGPSPAVR
jgi:tetratricopeptide repeat protein 8